MQFLRYKVGVCVGYIPFKYFISYNYIMQIKWLDGIGIPLITYNASGFDILRCFACVSRAVKPHYNF